MAALVRTDTLDDLCFSQFTKNASDGTGRFTDLRCQCGNRKTPVCFENVIIFYIVFYGVFYGVFPAILLISLSKSEMYSASCRLR